MKVMRCLKTICSVTIFSVLLPSVHALSDEDDLKMTTAEKIAMEKFKQSLETELNDPTFKSEFYLLRWLRQANLHIPDARKLLLQTISWREKNNITNILSEDWSDLEGDYPVLMEGQDKWGRPLLFLNFGDWNIRAVVFRGITQRFKRYLTYFSENMMQRVFQAQKEGKLVTRFVILIDLEGLNLRQHGCSQCLSILMQWMSESKTYYPLFTKEVILINVTGIFIVNTFRAASPPQLRNQVRSFDSNRHNWMTYLDQQIDKGERPQRFGGTKPE